MGVEDPYEAKKKLDPGKIRFATDDLVAPGQVAWAIWVEGPVEIAAKVIRGENGRTFLSLPTAYKYGTCIRVVRYLNDSAWRGRSRQILALFLATGI